MREREKEQRRALEASMTPEERKTRAQLQRFALRTDISDFYTTLFALDLRALGDSGELKKIQTEFEDGEEYALAMKPCFFSELRCDIERAVKEVELHRASCVQLAIYSEKGPFLYLAPGLNRDSRPVFQLTFKQDDFVLCVPASDPLPGTFRELVMGRTGGFLGICEHEVKNEQKQALLLVRTTRQESMYPQLSGSKHFYVVYLESLSTMLREYRMIQQAEFLDLSCYVMNPSVKPPAAAMDIPKAFFASVKEHFNESQFNAIAYACSRGDGFTLIQGPPGTGKTHTILGLIAAFLAVEGQIHPRVLVCAPSNAAIDEIASRAVRRGVFGVNGKPRPNTSFIRLGNWKQDHLEMKQRNSQNQRDPPPEVQQISLSTLVSQKLQAEGLRDQPELIGEFRTQLDHIEKAIEAAKGKGDVRTLEALGEKQRAVQSQLTREKHVRYSNEEKRRMYEMEVIQGANVVFATLSGAGSRDMEKTKPSFNYVIIDEACQAVELSCLIPLQYKARHVVLVGDPRQLPATSFSQSADRAGYSRSLFEVRQTCRGSSRRGAARSCSRYSTGWSRIYVLFHRGTFIVTFCRTMSR